MLKFLVAQALLLLTLQCIIKCSNCVNISNSELESELPIEVEINDVNSQSSLGKLSVESYPGELCNRACLPGDKRICYFKFVLEHYQAMGVACGNCKEGNEADCAHPQCVVGDGFEKGVMSINRQIPGPAIQVCQNDVVIVDVENMAGGTAAAIHWHGLHMRKTPWMDGVPFLTQCPISFSTSFRYQFIATQPGTQFYHSHSGHHKINGQYGAMIVRTPGDFHVKTYDYDLAEHYILISDWMHKYGEEIFPGQPSYGGIFPDSMLINGRGSYIDPRNNERNTVPPTRFYVTSGKRFRFRLINSVSHACPVEFQIESHVMTIIASDSYNVMPSEFNTIVLNSGERYDFVLEANQQSGDYWMRVIGLGMCTQTDSVALLRYVDNLENIDVHEREPLPEKPGFNDPFEAGKILNHPNSTCDMDDVKHCITALNAVENDDELRYAEPDYKFFLGFNNYHVENSELFQKGHYPHFINTRGNISLVGAINNLSFIFPHSPPLTQTEEVGNIVFCNEMNRPQHCNESQLCACVHRLYVRSGSIVEFIVVDESSGVGVFNHPFHLHGFKFLVSGLGQYSSNEHMTVKLAKELEQHRALPRTRSVASPLWKDTVSIPSCGYATLRFRADNPGYWLLHCHYEWHVHIGMGLILQVGDNEEMVPPPENFPKCGNFLPDLLPSIETIYAEDS